ncbi:TetR/AcrR family transcriptional regulator [Glycomyces algeriensis]|jgi:AcrR family transcriptional regulator|uniref:TetR family transcriptional regulator n=1 Tax=Glycomyces algeriensis TaxID=256037 RepID=A0A9W6LEY2_9ACTN|nr:TetR family transcriptional regulator [Glycomyces algeriensis]MDA1368883.1 TetR family transcriptional regulator [Glycomyces algeriensis]MDR7352843.1 AcrR family transcriptional regulator [Glycomyces algeriensis]GLI40530.1 TetR family transcriptional regulator [Glycomyces algeriensis]
MNRPGLRERKKIETLHRLQEEALRLFDEQGYDATTIEQIAEAAGVSPSTFYRYFPVKEDVVVQDEYDPLIVDVFESQQEGTAPLEALRAVLTALFREFTDEDIERVRRRVRMIFSVPALRARQVGQSAATERLLAQMVAQRTGRSAEELEVRHFTALVVASWTVAISAWAETDGTKDDLAANLDKCLAHLEAGAPL